MKGTKYNYATNNNKFRQQNNKINFLCFQIKKQFGGWRIMKIEKQKKNFSSLNCREKFTTKF